MRAFWLLAFLVILAATKNSSASSVREVVRKYVSYGDLDAFCTSIKEMYGKECKPEFTEEEEDQMSRVFSKSTISEMKEYIDMHVIATDPLFELDEDTCSELHREITKAPRGEIASVLTSYLDSTIATFVPTKYRSSKHKHARENIIRRSSSCNIRLLLEQLGTVTKSWNIPWSGYNMLGKLRDIPSWPSDIDVSSLFRSRTPAEKIIQARMRENQEKNQFIEEQRAKLDALSKLEKDCYIAKRKGSCNELDHKVKDYVFDALGPVSVQIITNDKTRTAMYYAARIVNWFHGYKLWDKLDVASAFLSTLVEYPLVVTVLFLVCVMWCRTSGAMIISSILAYNGALFIPIVHVVSSTWRGFRSRFTGIVLAIGILAVTMSLHHAWIDSAQSLTILYVLVVSYISLVANKGASVSMLLCMAPIAIYGIYSSNLVSLGFLNRETDIAEEQHPYSFDTAHILPMAAVYIGIYIILLSNMCDHFGIDTYHRAIRGEEIAPPRVNELIGCKLNHSTISVLIGFTLPAVFFIELLCLTFLAVLVAVVSAFITYRYYFHQRYLNAGIADRGSENIFRSMDILANKAPQAITVEHHKLVLASIVTIALLSGARVNVASAISMAALVGVASGKYKDHGQQLTIALSMLVVAFGTVPHITTGLGYLLYKVWHRSHLVRASEVFDKLFNGLSSWQAWYA